MVIRNWLQNWKSIGQKNHRRAGQHLIAPTEQMESRILLAAAGADLELSQTVNAPNPGLGSTVTFTVTLTNQGSQTANSITVSNPIPTGLSGVTVTPSGLGSYNSGTGVWSPPNLNTGDTSTLTITGTVTNVGTGITNTAEVTASGKTDPDSTPNNGVTTEDDYTSATQHVNFNPVLTTSNASYLDTISVNIPDGSNPGTLVSDLIARLTPGGISDADAGASQGIAINGATGTSTGAWQYSTDGGSNWAAIGSPNNDSARLLASDANTRVRYVPNTGFKGTAKISFVAWDQTAGSNGGTGVTKFRTGLSPFSLAYDYAQVTVTNAAPVLDASANPTLPQVLMNETGDTITGTSIESLIALTAGVSDTDPGAEQGIAVNGLTGTGTWEYSLNNGTNWSPIGTTGNTDARLLAADGNTLVRFIPNAGWKGTARIYFAAWDRTAGANGGTANVSSRGGTTPYSSAYEFASLSVVNSAPVLTVTGSAYLDTVVQPNEPFSSGGIQSLIAAIDPNPGTTVETLLSRGGSVTDLNPNTTFGIAINGLTGTANGSWEFSTDDGASWSAIGTTGNSNARLLAPTARVRFVPNLGFTGTAKLAYVAWDQSTGANGGVASVGTRGGSTAYSSLYDYATVEVVAEVILS